MWNKFKSLNPNMQDLFAAAMVTLVGLSLGLMFSALTGCTQQPAPAPEVIQAAPVAAAPVTAPAQAQPVVVVQQPAAAQNNGVGDFMMGALVGHALSGGGGGGGYHPAPVVHQTTVVNKTVVNKTVNVRPQARAYVSPRMSAPARAGGRR